MKKALLIGVSILVCIVVGCGFFGKGDTPEGVAESYIETKFENIKCDLSDLEYEIEEQEETAIVTITGKIKYNEKISLVKQDDKWMMATGLIKKVKAEKKKPEAKKASAHKAEKKADKPKDKHQEKETTAKTHH